MFFATGCFAREKVCSTDVKLYSRLCKRGALLLGRWFEEENTLCSQGSHKGILNGVELNMNKTCVFTFFFAMRAVCFCKNDFTHENAPLFTKFAQRFVKSY